MSKLGFRIVSTQDTRSFEKYAHLIVEIYDNEGGRWERLAKWRYQSDTDKDYWYSDNFEQWHANYRTRFENFVKLASKVAKNDMYSPNLQDLLDWLQAQRITRLSYDNRTNNVVPTTTLEKTKELNCYKIIRRSDGRYLEDVLAYSEHDALRNLPEYSKNDRQAAEYGVKLEQKYAAIGLNELKSITELITR